MLRTMIGRSLATVATIVGLAVATAGPSRAEDIVLKMAHVYTPGNIWYDTAVAYKKAVEERSGGKVKIEIADSGSTGDWPQSIEGLAIGTNDIVLQSIGTLDRYGIVAGVEAFPYLIRDLDHFNKVYDGPIGAELADAIAAQTRFRIVGAGYRGARHLTANRAVPTLADLKGLKLRVPPLKMYSMTWTMLGASAVPMGVAELFTSMQQKVVDGQENPLEIIESMRYDEVQSHVMETAHVMGAMTFIFYDARMKRLPEDVRTILVEEGRRTMNEASTRMAGMEAEIKKRLQEKGMTFVAVDRDAFAAKLADMPDQFPDLKPWIEKIRAVK
ncbi:ABC transporter substrate-binding protein [Tistrella bauzanensis]|uniref:ABC transporter substrate-binding protein n=1 Tax=Tistrella bauzanensis TaxID=657419 RepID=A0ABQ1IMS9_9PROT|nr:TRAP transporter substrate-binding protein [Tistrella bauzanensis]GGB47102.1 ABC transporter substrate-binding protein [Tistrella bauzanensis]